MGIVGYKQVTWQAASRYVRRHVFIQKASTGQMVEVLSIAKKGPNLYVVLADGWEGLMDKGRGFYVNDPKSRG